MRLIYFAFEIIIIFAYAWALIDIFRRRGSQWVHAARSKTFWTVWMIAGLAVALLRFVGFPVPLRGLLSLILIIGFVYYSGPERQRMGPPSGGSSGSWDGGPRRDRGGW